VLIENCLPLAIYPLLQVWPLCANRGVKAMTRQNNGVCRECKQFRIDGMNNGVEVAAFERGVARATWE
jgi:hypothetical protein